MQITETRSDGLVKDFTVTVGKEKLAEVFNARLAKLAKTIKMDGFRPGKVPLALVERQHGARIEGEVFEAVVEDAVKDLLTKQNIRPAVQPKMQVKEYARDKGLELSLTVEAIPAMPDVALDKISLQKHVITIDDAAIAKAMATIADAQKRYKESAKTRAAKTDDKITIDFCGKLKDVAFEGGTGEDMPVVIGAGTLIPGFEDNLIGLKLGESKDFNVTFPADYNNTTLAGQDATFSITVKKLEQPVKVEADEELAKSLGFENLAAMQEEVKKQLEKEFNDASRFVLKRKLLDALDASCEFDLPPSLVEEEFKAIKAEAEREAKQGHDDDHVHDENCNHSHDAAPEDAELQRIAIRRVKLGLLLADIGRNANVQVSNEEVHKAVLQQAYQYQPQMVKQILEYYRDNPRALDAIRAPLYEDKVVDLVLTKVQTSDVSVTREEFEKLQQDMLEQDEKQAA